jgi:hypothetical protein
MARRVARVIQFYRVRFFLKDASNHTTEVDPHGLFQSVAAMPGSQHPPGRYLMFADGNALAMEIDHIDGDVAGKIANFRQTDLPLVDDKQTKHPLTIRPEEGLYYPAHFVLFGGQVLGFEANFYGPRASAIDHFLSQTLRDNVSRVELQAIPKSGALERLRRIRDVKLFRIRVARDVIERSRVLDENVFDGLDALKRSTTSEELEIAFRPSKYSRGTFPLSWKRNIPRYLSDPVAKEGTSEFVIEGYDPQADQMVTIDLLQEYVVSEKVLRVIDERTRTVRSEDAYTAIRDVRGEFNSDIRRVLEPDRS